MQLANELLEVGSSDDREQRPWRLEVAAAWHWTEETGAPEADLPPVLCRRPCLLVSPLVAWLYPRSTSCDGHGARSVSQDALQHSARHLPLQCRATAAADSKSALLPCARSTRPGWAMLDLISSYFGALITKNDEQPCG